MRFPNLSTFRGKIFIWDDKDAFAHLIDLQMMHVPQEQKTQVNLCAAKQK